LVGMLPQFPSPSDLLPLLLDYLMTDPLNRAIFLMLGFLIAAVLFTRKSLPTSLRKRETLTRSLLHTARSLRCPLCDGETEVSRFSWRWWSCIVLLYCPSCKKEFMWEFRNDRWQLIAPLSSYVPQPLTSVGRPFKEQPPIRKEA